MTDQPTVIHTTREQLAAAIRPDRHVINTHNQIWYLDPGGWWISLCGLESYATLELLHSSLDGPVVELVPAGRVAELEQQLGSMEQHRDAIAADRAAAWTDDAQKAERIAELERKLATANEVAGVNRNHADELCRVVDAIAELHSDNPDDSGTCAAPGCDSDYPCPTVDQIRRPHRPVPIDGATIGPVLDEILSTLRRLAAQQQPIRLTAPQSVPASDPATEATSGGSVDVRAASEATQDNDGACRCCEGCDKPIGTTERQFIHGDRRWHHHCRPLLCQYASGPVGRYCGEPVGVRGQQLRRCDKHTA